MKSIHFILPLFLVLASCATSPEERKSSTFNLKDACAKSEFFKTSGTPSDWSAYIKWKGSDTTEHKDPVILFWESAGFRLPCGYGVKGDPSPMITIIWE